MTPRILFLDHVGVLGGAELSLLDIATHFRDRSRVVLFEDGPFREALVDVGVGVEVLPLPASVGGIAREGGLGHDLRAVPGVLRHARAIAHRAAAYDVLYANSQKAMVIASLAGVLAGKPVLWHLRDVMTADHFSRSHRLMTAAFGRLLVRRVLANSEATRDAYVHSGGPAACTFTVYNGIDEAPFMSSGSDAATVRRALGLGAAPLVGMFSRLAPWKGQHVLLEAMRDLPEVHALLVGEALFQDERRYAERLRRQAAEAGLDGRIHFLGFRRDVPALLRAVDVVVHASTAPEPFGRVIVEGMLAGRPVVATAAGGATEIIEHGRTGRLVPPDDAGALCRAVGDLLADPETAAALAAAGQADARQRFGLRAMLRAIDRHVAAVAPGLDPGRSESFPVPARPSPHQTA